MPKHVKPLTVDGARNAKPAAKPYKLAAGGGLYLEVMPNGSKYWRWKFYLNGTEKRLALGVFDAVSLKDARQARDAARMLVREGRDPSAEKRQAREVRAAASALTFQAVAEEWAALQKEQNTVAEMTQKKDKWLLSFLYPAIGRLPISQVTPRELLTALRAIEKSGKLETANRAKVKAGQVFRHAIREGYCEMDPTSSLRGALKQPEVKHHATVLEPAAVGELMRAIHGYRGEGITSYALRLTPLLFVRSGELRKAEWSEFDFREALWTIPAEHMKGIKGRKREPHLVPLSRQAIELLRELRGITGPDGLVFPSIRTKAAKTRSMSENTVNAALRRLGYDNSQQTAHGFRAMARTLLVERLNWRAEVIEMQLAHAVPDPLGRAYNRARFIEDRTRVMQEWADYLDKLRVGNVMEMKRLHR